MCRIGLFFWRLKRQVYKRSEYEPIVEDAEHEGILFIRTSDTSNNKILYCNAFFYAIKWRADRTVFVCITITIYNDKLSHHIYEIDLL